MRHCRSPKFSQNNIQPYLENALTASGLRSLFFIKEKSFSTAAILKEYGARNMTLSPRSSYQATDLADLWIEALSRSRTACDRQPLSASSKARLSLMRKYVKVADVFFP
jgi:hypothetical protein